MSCYLRMTLIVLILVGFHANAASAQQSSNSSENNRKWFVRAMLGSTRIHPWDDRGGWGEVRVGRTIGSASTSIDVGFAASGSRASFASLTSGLELQPWQASRISPFVRGEIGFLGESDYAGWIAGAGAGVVLRLRPRLGLRAGGALNAHGGVRGPVTSYGGMEYRW